MCYRVLWSIRNENLELKENVAYGHECGTTINSDINIITYQLVYHYNIDITVCMHTHIYMRAGTELVKMIKMNSIL